MAGYLAARDLQDFDPAGAFRHARDQAVVNTLMQRRQQQDEQAQQFSQDNALFNRGRLVQQDAAVAAKETAEQQAVQQTQQKRAAYAAAQRIAAAPLGQKRQMAMAALGQQGIAHYADQGIDIANLGEEDLHGLAQRIEASIGSELGLAPPSTPKPEAYTLGPGQKRFVDGKEVASVAPNPRSGMRIQSDGAGGFSLYEGPDASGVDLTNPTRNKLQEGAVNAQAGIDRLAGIRQGFDPRWLTYRGQFTQHLNSIRAKARGLPFVSSLSPQEQSDLSAFSRFKSDTTDNLNRYITEITGAAMGVQEAKRIISTMPSLEDDPQSFQSKLDQVEERLRLVLARSVYTQRNGIKFDAIPIDQMKSIMNRRGDELYQQNVRQLRDPQAARQATVEALEREFYQ